MPQRSRAADLAGAGLGAGAVALLSFADGGFFARAWPPATAGFAAAAALAVLLLPDRPLSRAELVFVAGLAGLAGWQGLSALWSLEPAASLREAQRGLVYVAAALAAVAIGRRGGAGGLLAGVAVGAVGVTGFSVVQRAVEGARDVPYQGTVLNQPLGYANALGILAALGLVLLVGAAARRRRPLFLVPAAPLVAALAFTSSRGAWLAATAGVVTLVLFAATRPAARAWWSAALAAGVAGALVSPLVWNPATLERALSDRPYYWWVAWQALPERLPLGSGAGTFDLLWAERAPIPVFVRDAHSLYLEVLVELGPEGLALVLLALLAPIAVAVPAPPGRLQAAAAGAYAAFLLHAGLDWDWELPAVTVAGLTCGAALLGAQPAARLTGIGRGRVAALAALLFALAVLSVILGRETASLAGSGHLSR